MAAELHLAEGRRERAIQILEIAFKKWGQLSPP